jgi:ribosome-binding ATPase YchF (GTP1/OBG family)
MKELHLLSAKPTLYVVNINEEDIHTGNDFPIQVEEYLSHDQDFDLITICGALESELSQIDGDEKNEFLKDLKLKEPALNKLVQSCYFERGFICAEVIAYKDYVALGGIQACKNAGKIRLEGKDYIVSEGDVIHFRFNV